MSGTHRNRVREIRQARDWQAEKLAVEAGVSLRTLYEVEAGKGCNLRTAQRISKAFGMRTDEVFPIPGGD